MDHLTVDEIIGYVTGVDVDGETRKDIAKINVHIIKCEECLRKVRAMQVISEGLEAEYSARKVREILLEKTAESKTLTKEGKKLKGKA